MPEERKLASMLFADIVGSTPITGAADPEVVRRSLARVFAEMREVLLLHGGTVEKFIGDAVMAVFGVPVAHDDDAERAVRAAFALRERVIRVAPELAFTVQLRIGVNTGQIVAGTEPVDTLVTGSPVIVASRLQQEAAPGEILVGALTHTLTSAAVRYGSARRFDAKGVGETEAFPAVALRTAVPEQRRGIGELRAPLIGRDQELRLLSESRRKAMDARTPYLVTVYGQAGVGKSRLVRELVSSIANEPVLRGRCLPYGIGVTYWPLQEMLRADMRIKPDDGHDDAVAKLHERVDAAFLNARDDAVSVADRLCVICGLQRPEDVLPGTSAADLAQELRWATRRYFERRGDQEPLTLIFDDIHWADETMLQLIEHLAEWSRTRLFIVCLARPDLRDQRPGWGGGLMNAGALRLEPLTPDQTKHLIAALLPIEELPENLRDSIVARAQGNPLYAEEMLRMLIDAGHVVRRHEKWVASASMTTVEVPASLQGLLTARLDQLAPEVKLLLQHAAVIGKVFYPQALSALAGPSSAIEQYLTAAARRDFVIERDERGPTGERAWQFKHILIRDVAYESLSKDERSRLHHAFGVWLESVTPERRDEYAEIVAYHADRAYGLARELRLASSGELGERALTLQLACARRAWRTGERRNGFTLFTRSRDIAEEIVASLDVRVETHAFAALGRLVFEGRTAASPDLEKALVLARSSPPSEGLIELLADRTLAALETGDDGSEGIAAAKALGDGDLVVEAILASMWPAWYRGDMRDCSRIIEHAGEYVRNGFRRHEPEYLRRRLAVARETGDFAVFEEVTAQRLRASASHESRIARVITPKQAAVGLAYLGGDPNEDLRARAELFEAVASVGEKPDAAAIAGYSHALQLLGRHEEAVEAGRKAVARAEEKGYGSNFVGEVRQTLARALLRAGRLAEADAMAELARSEIKGVDPQSWTSTAATLAMVRTAQGRDRDADALFRTAIEAARGFHFEATRARVDYAKFLISRGRLEEARVQLQKARDFYGHPLVAGRRAEVETLLVRCDQVRA